MTDDEPLTVESFLAAASRSTSIRDRAKALLEAEEMAKRDADAAIVQECRDAIPGLMEDLLEAPPEEIASARIWSDDKQPRCAFFEVDGLRFKAARQAMADEYRIAVWYLKPPSYTGTQLIRSLMDLARAL